MVMTSLVVDVLIFFIPQFYGNIYREEIRGIDKVRQAVLEFRDNYNRYWRLQKLGFMTPLEARQRYENERLQPVAA